MQTICGWPTELVMVLAAVGVGLVQLGWSAAAGVRQTSLPWAAGPRDEPRPVSGVAGRLTRAFANFRESFPLFSAAAIALVVMGEAGALSAWGSILYVAARVAYVPLYVIGVPWLRTLVWAAGLGGMLMVLAEAVV